MMRTRMFLSAMFKLRNIAALVTEIFLAALLTDQLRIPDNYNLLILAVSTAVYFGFVIQTLSSKTFHEDFNRKEKYRTIRNLNSQANRLAGEARRKTNNTYTQKLRRMMEDKNDIFMSYSTGEPSYLKEKIVERTLNLVIAYLRLLTNFCARNRELSSVDLNAVVARLNANTRKLGFTRDPGAAEDIRKIIGIDEKLINRLKDEKKELERISTKLDYMESTVNSFKHQVQSSVENEEMLEQLETAVSEAEALDTVLDERRKNRIRI